MAAGADVMLVTADLHPESEGLRTYETVLLGRPVPTADWINVARAYRKARTFKPDVVVTELLRDPRWRVFGGLGRRVRLVHDDKPHDQTHADPWWIRSFEPWDNRADATIVFSDYVADKVRARGPEDAPVHVAPLMTDLDPALVPGVVPAEDRQHFVLIGRQRPYKNHAVVFAAWEAHVNGPTWRGDELLLLGDGEVPQPLPPHTRWLRTDFRYREVVDIVAKAKGSLIHARSASQSGVHVVSMQLGVPPIVSDRGALPEYQPPGLSVTDVDDVVGLSRALDTLADPAEVERQSRIALDHYNRHYSTSIASDRLLNILQEVARS
jgi:glycosyltransferase involved in cell wall biosynthesis